MASNVLHNPSPNARGRAGEAGERESRVARASATRPRYLLTGVIAVVGCDGSGKSTLTADICTRLRDVFVTRLVYLGQDSGNILRSIVDVPLVGSAIGRYLVRRSQRAHADGDRPAEPDALTATALYLLSRWRYRKFRRLLALHREGKLVVTDRYPQSEVAGFHFDGSGLSTTGRAGAYGRWLAARERRLYEDMAAYVPALLIRLNVDAETAHVRKPDHRLATLRQKASVIPKLAFNGAPILELDGTAPYPEVLEAALKATRVALDSGSREAAV